MTRFRLLRIFILGVSLMATIGVALTHSGVAYAASQGCPSSTNDNPNNWQWQQVAVTNNNVYGESVAVVLQAAISGLSFGYTHPLCNVYQSVSVVNMTQPSGQIITNTYGIGDSYLCDGSGPCPTFTQGNWILPNYSGQVVAYTSGMVFGSCAVANMYFKNVLTQVRDGC